ncbi:two-component sensor histidine kinase [Thermus sp. LT1-2-5]|uniref:sensor histidine kinase n=1 Tax=Thermus sp. LT1-2-5 TaxID=3026935 RepID=UPI0030EA18F5
MSLRLRLTLSYVLLLSLVLGGLGLFLHVSIRSSLYSAVDVTLRGALEVARTLVDEENGLLRLEGEGEALPPDLGLFLYRGGGLVDRRGPALPPPPQVAVGCSTMGEVRYCAMAVDGGVLVAARSLEAMEMALARTDTVLLLAFLTALGLSFLLGYALAGQALAPLNRMARRALELAETPDPKARLPEPRSWDEVGRLARAQNLLLAALERVLEGERQFVRYAAHELRTPLAVLVGRLEQALEMPTPQRRPLEKALEAALHLKALAERLLFLVRAEAPAAREAVDLTEVVLEAIEGLPLSKRVELDLPQAVPYRGDGALLKALVRNLAENALRHAYTRMAIRLQPGPCIVVEDDGPGIPPERREEVFRPFVRLDQGGGSGLGLTLVRRVAEAHGGYVQVGESPWGGARFRVCLGPREGV